ncbi:MAG: hypothetical protein DBX48_08735 [Limosilactobacillus fermentum]|nr:MAG: hypothetical protein DBX48_08735 [Limosilactobacillus fermentum]
MKLKESPVVFDQEKHTYRLRDIVLEGVTTLLRNQLFQSKYDGVPDFVMERAKEKGTLVHEQCELVDELGIEPVVLEAKNYKLLKEEHGLKTIANEYLISDEVAFASSIDVIFDAGSENDDEVYLADIKTTSKLDVDWLSWQLSIYAYMFEMQNPHLKVKKLYAIWLRNEVKELKEVQRIDSDTIQKLLECEMNGESFTSSDVPLPENGEIIPVEVFERAQIIISLDGKIKQLTEEKKRISEELYQYMEEIGESKCEHELFIVSRVMPTTKKSLDAKGLEKCEPAIYKQFLKETAVKGSIRVTPRK